jgi:hypothetical protein
MSERRKGMRLREHWARCAALSLATLVAAWATVQASPVEFGLHGGLSIPNIHGNTEQSRAYASRLGPFFGATAGLQLIPHLWLCAEVNYSSQGGKRNGLQPITGDQASGLPLPPDTPVYANFNSETILDYIEVPVFLKLMTGGRYRAYLEAGPYIGFRVRSVTDTSGSSLIFLDSAGTMPVTADPVDFTAHTDISSDVHDLNAGFTGGAGAEMTAGPGSVVLGLRFTLGLANIQPNPEVNGKNHTGALVILAGYRLAL